MNSPASVLIGFTPYHLIPMLEIAKSLNGSIYFFHPDVSSNEVRGLQLNLIFLGSCELVTRKKFFKYFIAAQELKRLLSQREDVSVYVPHPYGTLSNYVFFSTHVTERYIFQDGILNYYDTKNPFVSFKKRFERRISSYALGLSYRFYEGHISGIDAQKVSGGFFTHPEKIVSANKFPAIARLKFLSMDSDDTNLDKTNGFILFLDQSIEYLVEPQIALATRQKAQDFVDSFGERVLYKPHHEQKTAPTVRNHWLTLGGNDHSLPAELLMSKYNITKVVSFYSSALINIAFENPSVQCYAVGANLISITIDSRETTLAELFSNFGVIVVE
jgi:Alpha-2,8-polysialyltransferase (POLYST)